MTGCPGVPPQTNRRAAAWAGRPGMNGVMRTTLRKAEARVDAWRAAFNDRHDRHGHQQHRIAADADHVDRAC